MRYPIDFLFPYHFLLSMCMVSSCLPLILITFVFVVLILRPTLLASSLILVVFCCTLGGGCSDQLDKCHVICKVENDNLSLMLTSILFQTHP